MDALFDVYARSLPCHAWAAEPFPPAPGESPAAHARAIKAKALDLLRGLLPATSLSHMGIFATGQTYEQLILHLLAHPLPEARAYGSEILDAVRAVMPSFVARVERPDRGGEWIDYLQQRELAARERWAGRLGLDRAAATATAGRRCACCTSRATRIGCSRRCCSRPPACPRGEMLDTVAESRRRDEGGDAGRPRRRARQPPPPAGPGLRGAPLPLRDRLRLRRLPRPAAPPDAHCAVAGARPRARRRDPRGGCADAASATTIAARSRSRDANRSASSTPATSAPRRTRCASATGSATCSTSTPARRCS